MEQSTLVFATNNAHKISEVKLLLGEAYTLRSLRDIGCHEELPETGNTLEHNAKEKADYVHTTYGVDCFSEDTGLEVAALAGAPGADTAHYAGPQRSADDNMDKLLTALDGASDRSARFRTVIALHLDGAYHQFEGVVNGRIAEARMGKGGFGYDPVFVPDGYDVSFAQMSTAEKSRISHRGRAIEKLVDFLKKTA